MTADQNSDKTFFFSCCYNRKIESIWAGGGNTPILQIVKKGRDLTQSHDKSPYYNKQKCQKGMTIKDVTKKFGNTAIDDRLRTVSWSSYSHPTGVVHRFTGLTFPLPQQPWNQIDTHLKICKQTSLYRHQTNSHTKRRGSKSDTHTA